MPQYSCSVPTIGLTLENTPRIFNLLEIRTGPTDYINVSAIFATIMPGTGGDEYGVGKPAARGVPLNGYSPVPYDPNSPPSNVTFVTDWSVAPTPPAFFFRRAYMVGPGNRTPAQSIQFIFPNGLRLAPSSSLVVCTPGTQLAGGGEVWVEFDG